MEEDVVKSEEENDSTHDDVPMVMGVAPLPKMLSSREFNYQRGRDEQRVSELIAEERFLSRPHFKEVICQLGPPKDVDDSTRSTFLMVFSPDKELIASTHGDHNIYITRNHTGTFVRTLKGHPRTPWTVAFHPNRANLLASGCLGGEVRVWDIHGGCELWRSNCVIASLAFHPQDQVLVIASFNLLHFWNWSFAEPFAKTKTKTELEKVRYVKFDSLGRTLITGIANYFRGFNETSLSTRNQGQNSSFFHVSRVSSPSSLLEVDSDFRTQALSEPTIDENVSFRIIQRRYQLLNQELDSTLNSDTNAIADENSENHSNSPHMVDQHSSSIQTLSFFDTSDSTSSSSESELETNNRTLSFEHARYNELWRRRMIEARRNARWRNQSRVRGRSPSVADEASTSDRQSRIIELLDRRDSLVSQIDDLRSAQNAILNSEGGDLPIDRWAERMRHHITSNRSSNDVLSSSSRSTPVDDSANVTMLRRNISNMQRICRSSLASVAHAHQQSQSQFVLMNKLNSIRRMLKNLQRQIQRLRLSRSPRHSFRNRLRHVPETMPMPRAFRFRRNSNHRRLTSSNNVDRLSNIHTRLVSQLRASFRGQQNDSTSPGDGAVSAAATSSSILTNTRDRLLAVSRRLELISRDHRELLDRHNQSTDTINNDGQSIQPQVSSRKRWSNFPPLADEQAICWRPTSIRRSRSTRSVNNSSGQRPVVDRNINNASVELSSTALRRESGRFSHLSEYVRRTSLRDWRHNNFGIRRNSERGRTLELYHGINEQSHLPALLNAEELSSSSTQENVGDSIYSNLPSSSVVEDESADLPPLRDLIWRRLRRRSAQLNRLQQRLRTNSNVEQRDQEDFEQYSVSGNASNRHREILSWMVDQMSLEQNGASSDMRHLARYRRVVRDVARAPMAESARHEDVQRATYFYPYHGSPYISLTHRIQAWDFSNFEIPDLSQNSVNVIVSESRINNDASVDITADGSLLVALVPSVLPMTNLVNVYGLNGTNNIRRGACIASFCLESSAVSVSFSPTQRYLIVGLTSRFSRLLISNAMERPLMAQVFRIQLPSERRLESGGGIPSEKGRLIWRRDIFQMDDQNLNGRIAQSALNCIRWIPGAGQGLVLATNTGLLKIIR